MGTGVTFGGNSFYVTHKITQWPFPVIAWKEDGDCLIPYIADGNSGTPCLVDLNDYTVHQPGTLPVPKPDRSEAWEAHIRMISGVFFDDFPEPTDHDYRRWAREKAAFWGEIDALSANYRAEKRAKGGES